MQAIPSPNQASQAVATFPGFPNVSTMPLKIFIKICLEHADMLNYPRLCLVSKSWAQVLCGETFRRNFITRYFPDSLAKNPPTSLVEVIKLQMEQLRIAYHITNNYYIKRNGPCGIAACIDGDQTLVWREEIGPLKNSRVGDFAGEKYTALHFANNCAYGATLNGELHIRENSKIVHKGSIPPGRAIDHIRGFDDWIYFANREDSTVQVYHKSKGVLPGKLGNGPSKVTCLEATPQHLCIGYADGQIEVLDRESGNFVRRFHHQGGPQESLRLKGVTCLQHSQGKLYVGGSNGNISIWSLLENTIRPWNALERIYIGQSPVFSLNVHDCWLFVGVQATNFDRGESSLLCYNIFTFQKRRIYDSLFESPQPRVHAPVSFVRFQDGQLVTIFNQISCRIFDFTPAKMEVLRDLVLQKNPGEIKARFLNVEDEKAVKAYREKPEFLKEKFDKSGKEGCSVC